MSRSLRSPGPPAILAVVTGLACALALAVAPASAAGGMPDDRPGALPTLKGHVGPGFEISISDRSVPAGRYRVVVKDEGTIHNFHMKGDGVDRETSVPGTGREVWRVRLTPGTYKIHCNPHRTTMKTTLTVT